MFSRLVSRAVVQSQPLVSRPIVFGIQKASSAPEKPSASTKIIPLEELEDPLDKVPRKFVTRQEGPERDLVNFPRPVVKEHPDPVRFGFVPDEWFEIFYKKTGVSGPYMFGLSVGTWLLSKEIFVLEHNFYNGISLVLIIMIMHHKLGPKIAAWADKEMEREDKHLEELDADEKDHCRANIKAIDEYLSKLEVYKDIANVKREIAGAALEVTYREWMKNAYTEAKKRLDFQLALAEVERRVSQKNVSSWVTDSVLKSITPAQEQEALKKCILDLKSLSASA